MSNTDPNFVAYLSNFMQRHDAWFTTPGERAMMRDLTVKDDLLPVVGLGEDLAEEVVDEELQEPAWR